LAILSTICRPTAQTQARAGSNRRGFASIPRTRKPKIRNTVFIFADDYGSWPNRVFTMAMPPSQFLTVVHGPFRRWAVSQQ